MDIRDFQDTVWRHYHDFGRDLPWRNTTDPYKILVSEIMLQQTQVSRVIPKYKQFLKQFPDAQTLAAAPLSRVITAWSGLGYNRRAKYVHQAAEHLVSKNHPWKLEDLIVCPGIGHNTAAAVLTYAYNQPTPFIETNVRTVYIHHFFREDEIVSDKQLLPLVEQTLDRQNPREFMWAVMDYGSYLKSTAGNSTRRSKHYAKQSRFEGSRRQVRGKVLQLLTTGAVSTDQLAAVITDKRLPDVLADLAHEGFIHQKSGQYFLT